MSNINIEEDATSSYSLGRSVDTLVTSIGKNLNLDDNSKHADPDYLQEQLPRIFSVKQDKIQRYMKAGRNPKSLQTHNEMSHYLRLSHERQARIEKGHTFWSVVEEESLIHKYPTDKDYSKIVAAEEEDALSNSRYEILAASKVTPAPTNVKNNAIDRQATAFNSLADLKTRIDFKGVNQVNYNNTFIIMNYLDEVLYVNIYNQLRCKPIDKLIPSDRVKFRLLDLQNLTNPSSLKYDDPVWLQICENSDTGETTLSTASLIAAKLQGPPPLESVTFEMPQDANDPPHISEQKTQEKNSNKNKEDKSATICGSLDVLRIIDKHKTMAESESSTGGEGTKYRYASRSSGVLGRWVIHSAERKDSKVENPEDVHVMSSSPIYIQQDLYCIGTTKDKNYHIWPLASDKQLKPRPRISQREYNTAVEETYDYGCVRKVVKRGFPYDFSIDRKCVWKLCLFEQYANTAREGQDKDRASQRIMHNAVNRLKISRQLREEGRLYKEYDDPALPSLRGGEKFPHTLRYIVNTQLQQREQHILHDLRSRESQVLQYFHDKRDIFKTYDEDCMEVESQDMGAQYRASAASLAVGSEQKSLDDTLSAMSQMTMSQKVPQPDDDDTSIASEMTTQTSSSGIYFPHHLGLKQRPLTFSGEVSKNEIHHYPLTQKRGGASTTTMRKFAVDPHLELDKRLVDMNLGDDASEGSHSTEKFSVGGSQIKQPKNIIESPPIEYSPEIMAVFCGTGKKRLEPAQLLLDRREAMKDYDRLSEGERVVAHHKTFSHLFKKYQVTKQSNMDTSANPNPNNPPVVKKKNLSTEAVAKRLASLRDQDQIVLKVLDYQERVLKEKELVEHVVHMT